MEIKTSHNIFKILHNGTMDKSFAEKKWVAVDNVLETIHKIREMKIDAEDMIKELTK